MTKFRAVLFDAAETLFTTRGSVGEIYGSLAQQYGSKAPTDAIQAAFARQFRGAGPLSQQDQKLNETRAQLRESFSRYNELHDLSPVGFLTLNRKACITELNEKAAHNVGEEVGLPGRVQGWVAKAKELTAE